MPVQTSQARPRMFCNGQSCVDGVARAAWSRGRSLPRMSKYLDRHGTALHKDDAVRIEGCGADLEHAEGVIHSFYLVRDGKDRARVHLTGQGGRAVGVKVDLLTKIHDEGPEPVFDALMPHASAISDALGRSVVMPGGTSRISAAGPFGDAVVALAVALVEAIGALDEAIGTWPPPIEATDLGRLTPRAQEVKRASDALRRIPPRAEAMVGVEQAAALMAPMRQLTDALIEGSEHTIRAFGCYLPVERDFLDVDASTGGPAGGLARVSAGGRLADAFKSASRLARVPQEAFRHRDDAMARLYAARHCVSTLRPLFFEPGEPLSRAAAALERSTAPNLAARVGLHRPPRASVHAREERRGGYLFYVPDDWVGASEPLALVVALHGKESNGPAFFWRLARLACSRRFALLAPSSLGFSWGTPPPEWALPDPKRPGANADVDNVLCLLDEIHARYPIDAARTLLLGYCEGAPFALKLALAARHAVGWTSEDCDRFAALALLGSNLPSFPTALPPAASPLRVYWSVGSLDVLHPPRQAKRSARELAKVDGVTVTWREMNGVGHVFPPEAETRRLLAWFHESMMLDGEERPRDTPLEPRLPEAEAGAAADSTEGEQTGGETSAATSDRLKPPPQQQQQPALPTTYSTDEQELHAMLRRLDLEHLGKVFASEEIDLPLLRAMSDLTVELAELGVSAAELQRLEAAIRPPDSTELDSNRGDGSVELQVN